MIGPIFPAVEGRVENRFRLLCGWITRKVDERQSAWFLETARQCATASGLLGLGRAISLAPRKLGKSDIEIGPDDRRDAERVGPGFDPTGLSTDQAARIAFILAAFRDNDSFAETIDDVCQTGDLGELIACYRGFAIFPLTARLMPRAAEAVRSTVKPIFESIAHRNPVPCERFDQASWNQMVLKALFIGSALAPIQGLDERANPDLARVLVDYARERRAAGRVVSAELWRCVEPFADEADRKAFYERH